MTKAPLHFLSMRLQSISLSVFCLSYAFSFDIGDRGSSKSASLAQLYHDARQKRINEGHDKAQPLYREILRLNPSDLTAATRIAASSDTTLQLLQQALLRKDDSYAAVIPNSASKMSDLRDWFISCHFNCQSIEQILKRSTKQRVKEGQDFPQAVAPIYISPATAGSVDRFPFSLATVSACECLVALFLLGVAVPEAAALSCCLEKNIQLLKDLGLICSCEHDPTLLLGLVSIMPIDLPLGELSSKMTTIFVVTDWHPRVLNTIRLLDNVGQQQQPSSLSSSSPLLPPATSIEEAVMYIGPDSLALVEHWLLHPKLPKVDTLLDICTGSGVQALVCLAMGTCKAAVCVDINPRALRFVAFSAALNGLSPESIVLVRGDVVAGTGRVVSPGQVWQQSDWPHDLVELLQDIQRNLTLSSKFDMMTCNPPFLPVPNEPEASFTTPSSVSTKHGWFSAGGATGHVVLGASLNLARNLLSEQGTVAIVSEFFLERDDGPCGLLNNNGLLGRLSSYWMVEPNSARAESGSATRAMLLTNEYPISAATYAERRAESKEEAMEWERHLKCINVTACSPGFLFLQSHLCVSDSWKHVIVPKSERGSLWTPGNNVAIGFTRNVIQTLFSRPSLN